jgi:tRNA(Ile)-lysidine synthase
VSAFVKRIQNTAFRHRLWTKGTKMVVGVSGGPDSVCLLDVLAGLREKYGWELHVAHVNYGLRGEESRLDEVFVRSLADHYGLPCSVLRPRIKKTQTNLEETLRDIRYAFFEKVRKGRGLDVIAVAHTLDDQAETVLMRLLRGSGTLGLQAMRPKRDAVIRPLLDTARQDVLDYLDQRQVSYRLDSSNTENCFFRNRIRHDLIPYLERQFQPSLKKILARNAAILEEDSDALLSCLKDRSIPFHKEGKTIAFSVSALRTLHPSLQKLLIRQFFEELRSDLAGIEFSHMEEMFKIVRSSKNKNQILSFGRLKVLRNGDTVTMTLA